MTTPLNIGSYHTIYLGPAISSDGEAGSGPAVVDHDAAGIKVEVQLGNSAPVDVTASLVDTAGDWYWRAVGTLGMHALDVPASYFVSENVGKMLRVDAVADGVHLFGNRESLIVIDASYIDEERRLTAAEVATGLSYEIDMTSNPPTLIVRYRDDETLVATMPLAFVERDPIQSIGVE